MKNSNVLTQAVVSIRGQMAALREHYGKPPQPPFMTEEVSLESYRRKVDAMLFEERIAEAQKVGMAKFMKMMEPKAGEQ